MKKTAVRSGSLLFIFVLFFIGPFFLSQAIPQNRDEVFDQPASDKLRPVKAVMCEEVKEQDPQNQSIVFSVNVGRVLCFTSFDPVPEKTFIFHNWFFRDKLNMKRKLSLQPPRWDTFSSFNPRETDKGPWRVEILDEKGNILDILRFSIVD
ncbi:MAG: DUF2914 domain-containing protein [Pseudomonadota bacterium]